MMMLESSEDETHLSTAEVLSLMGGLDPLEAMRSQSSWEISPDDLPDSFSPGILDSDDSVESMPGLTSHPAVTSQLSVTSQPAGTSQLSVTSQPTVTSQLSVTSQPTVTSQLSTTSQPTVTSQPSATSQLSTTSRLSVTSQLSTTSRPTVTSQPSERKKTTNFKLRGKTKSSAMDSSVRRKKSSGKRSKVLSVFDMLSDSDSDNVGQTHTQVPTVPHQPPQAEFDVGAGLPRTVDSNSDQDIWQDDRGGKRKRLRLQARSPRKKIKKRSQVIPSTVTTAVVDSSTTVALPGTSGHVAAGLLPSDGRDHRESPQCTCTKSSESSRSSTRSKTVPFHHRTPVEPRSADDDIIFVSHVTNNLINHEQIAKDEEFARQLQEEINREVSGADSFPVHGSSERIPGGSIAGGSTPRSSPAGGVPGSLDRQTRMLNRIGTLSEHEWNRYEALYHDRTPPATPETGHHRKFHEVFDPSILEFMEEQRMRQAAVMSANPTPPVTIGTATTSTRRQPRPQAAPRGRSRTRTPALDLSFLADPSDMMADIRNNLNSFMHRRPGRTARRGRPRLHDEFDRLQRLGEESSGSEGQYYERLLELTDMLGEVKQKGMYASQIDQLPTNIYESSTKSTAVKECSICISQYEEGDKLRMLTCLHQFHALCVDQWLKESASCPICREDIKLDH